MKEELIQHPVLGELILRPHKNSKRVHLYYKQDKILISYPAQHPQELIIEGLLLSKDAIEKLRNNRKKEYRNIFQNIDRVMAKKVLTQRLQMYAKRFDFTYSRVFIRNQITRWGSFSSKGNINLNCKLVRLPIEIMDYVILHELVHSRVKNHSKDFWAELAKYCPDYKRIHAKLLKYKTR